jgi:predicted nuclease of restriction endonuclease-like (RecB) superfamily
MSQAMTLTYDFLFESIRAIVARSRERVYLVANSVLLDTYWQIGRLIVEDEQGGEERAQYGKAVLKNLAGRLTMEFGKGFDESNLRNMRAFFMAFPIRDAARHELSWTHYRILSRISSPEKRIFYLNQAAESGWNSRLLQRNIDSMAFERAVALPAADEEAKPEHVVKDPYIFEFLGLPTSEATQENNLESAIIDNLQAFLLELGKGFAFVARQQRISTDTSDFYLDLVFYNYILKCFVIFDLKTGPLDHQAIGQIDMYVRMYDDLKRGPGDNPTMGILLCTEKDETMVKYSVLAESKHLFASNYLLCMPQEHELKRLIERGRERFAADRLAPRPKKAA